MNKNQRFDQDQTSRSYEQCKKLRNFATGCSVPQHEQKSMFDEDQASSSSEKCKKVTGNLETLQVAAECYSMNKNQSLIKIKPVVPGKNVRNWENCETLQLAAEWHSINKNQRLDQDQTSSS